MASGCSKTTTSPPLVFPLPLEYLTLTLYQVTVVAMVRHVTDLLSSLAQQPNVLPTKHGAGLLMMIVGLPLSTHTRSKSPNGDGIVANTGNGVGGPPPMGIVETTPALPDDADIAGTRKRAAAAQEGDADVVKRTRR